MNSLVPEHQSPLVWVWTMRTIRPAADQGPHLPRCRILLRASLLHPQKISTRLDALSNQLESALELSRSLQAQHAAAQNTSHSSRQRSTRSSRLCTRPRLRHKLMSQRQRRNAPPSVPLSMSGRKVWRVSGEECKKSGLKSARALPEHATNGSRVFTPSRKALKVPSPK
jgi:hypothetical protein